LLDNFAWEGNIMTFKRMLVCAAAVGASAIAFNAAAQENRTMLTLTSAKKMADACEQKARAEGWKLVIAIVDSGANLKLLERMDDSFHISVRIAQLKANTSAGVPLSSRKFGELSKDVKGIELVPGTAAFPGGLPIMTASGQHIGGIGVSGATGDQDEACAQVALDAVKDTLK
jgi:glc operon protein GlcG